MAPKELPSYYLYSHGISPKVLTLGTLVYDNYGMPETQNAPFPMSDDEFEKLEKADEIISQPISGCFTYTKNSKYGLGVGFAELANLDFEYARNCKKLVNAKEGQRVYLNNPDAFFKRVLARQESLEKLTSWLTAAKSAWLFFCKVTFQKPKVYCCTGYYRLSQVNAKIDSGGSWSGKVNVSPAVMGAATTVPVGGTIGPFSNGKSLEANVTLAERAIWAARFHELKVEYLQIAQDAKTQLPPHIKLSPDCTHPRGALMHEVPISVTREVQDLEEIRRAQGATTTWVEAEEIGDGNELDQMYWKAFNKALYRLEGKSDSADD